MGEKSFLKISGIRKSFGSGENRTEVLKGIDFEVAKGEFCVPSGTLGGFFHACSFNLYVRDIFVVRFSCT